MLFALKQYLPKVHLLYTQRVYSSIQLVAGLMFWLFFHLVYWKSLSTPIPWNFLLPFSPPWESFPLLSLACSWPRVWAAPGKGPSSLTAAQKEDGTPSFVKKRGCCSGASPEGTTSRCQGWLTAPKWLWEGAGGGGCVGRVPCGCGGHQGWVAVTGQQGGLRDMAVT